MNDIKSISQNGFFDVYFSFLGTNGEVVNSNIETFQVNSNNIELSILSQDISLLRDNISDKYNGIYINANQNFNSDKLLSINKHFSVIEYSEIFNALDIFIKEKIFFIIILLFSLEIYFRKKVGLL